MYISGQPSEPNRTYLIQEEDWGLVCIVPAENRDDLVTLFGHLARAEDKTKLIRFRSSLEGISCPGSEQIQKLGQFVPKHDDPTTQITEHPGSIPRFLILEEKVAIDGRAIPHSELCESFGGLLPPAEMVLTARPATPRGRKCQNCFALGRTGATALYGTQENGAVTSLHLQHNPVQKLDRNALTRALVFLGAEYRLILLDWARRRIVDLSDTKQIDEYLGQISTGPETGFRDLKISEFEKWPPPEFPSVVATRFFLRICLIVFFVWLLLGMVISSAFFWNQVCSCSP